MRASSLSSLLAVGLLAACVASFASSPVALADPPALEARVSALGPVREGETELFAQLAGALEIAETSGAEGGSARAERHRDLALAIVRTLEARRRVLELRARLEERARAHAAVRERLEAARAAAAQAGSDAARVEAP